MNIIEFFYYILLGIVQGITEFLPISSSGHLEVVEHFFSTQSQGFFIPIVLHFATAISIIFVFRKKIKEIIFPSQHKKEYRDYVLKISIALIPAILVGLLFEKEIEARFFSGDNIMIIAGLFVITGFILWFTKKRPIRFKDLTIMSAFLIGCAQAFAILPGISRSGTTICMALFLGIKKNEATSFSFILFLPLIFGKIAKDILFETSALKEEFMTINFPALLIAFLIAFIVGLLCCQWMIKIVENNKLEKFGDYCIALAIFLMFTKIC